jgi:hypothetical protein
MRQVRFLCREPNRRVVQLAERSPDKREIVGSSPTPSTMLRTVGIVAVHRSYTPARGVRFPHRLPVRGAIVQWLGLRVLTAKMRVRFSLALPTLRTKAAVRPLRMGTALPRGGINSSPNLFRCRRRGRWLCLACLSSRRARVRFPSTVPFWGSSRTVSILGLGPRDGGSTPPFPTIQ